MYFHAIAILPGDRRKTIVNKNEEQMLTEIAIPYVSSGLVEAKWGSKTQSYQVIDLRIYRTDKAWDKKSGRPLDEFIGNGRNVYAGFAKRAQRALGKKNYRVFIIMPIQGEKFGSQNDQRIYAEYDKRYEVLEKLLGNTFSCVAIRIDKEHPMDDLVARIKSEIKKAKFVIADLTDERPSCYFEAGYAEALKKPTLYIASKESVVTPGRATTIHFDVHMNVNRFTNHTELEQKVKAAIEKNREILFATESDSPQLSAAETLT